MRTIVRGESQGKNKTVILERIMGQPNNNYRVTVCTRYGSFDKGADAFLSETPKNHKQHYLAQIEEAKKQLHKRDREGDNKPI